MYRKHFGFEALPFCVTPDPRFFYSTEIYQDVLDGLEHGIDAKSAFIVVTGEVGTGKTTLLRRLIYCSADKVDYVFVNVHPQLSLTALLRAILKELRVPSSSTDQQCLLEELGSHVLDRFTKGRSVALLFDEAQDMSDEMLRELPVIWNLAIKSEKLIPIVLVGQPELVTRLKSSKLRQLGQHVTLWRRLGPFSDHDVASYITTRLEHVGYRGEELFEPAAIETLISRSSGIPRFINNICDNALLRAYRSSQYKVTAAMIDEIADQLRLAELPIRPNRKNIDELANQWPFGDLLRVAGDNKIIPSGGRRFGARAASADAIEIDEGPKHIADRTPLASKTNNEVVAKMPRQHREILPVKDQPESDERWVPGAKEANHARDETARENGARIAPSLRDLVVDQRPFLDRLASPAQKRETGINGLETPLPTGTLTACNTLDGPLREPSFFEPEQGGWLSERLNNVNRLTLSIRAVMVLTMLALVLVRFYPSKHEAAVPQINHTVETPLREGFRVAAAAKPIGKITGETRIEEPLQRVLASPSPDLGIPQDRDQHQMNPPKKQKIVEASNNPKIARPPSEGVYRVTEASILRKRPTANSEIVDTLLPGTRIRVTSRSGEYLRVRPLAGEKVAGFVHKEDAFFERAVK